MGNAVVERNGTVAKTARGTLGVDAIRSQVKHSKTKALDEYRQMVRDIVRASDAATVSRLTPEFIQDVYSRAGKTLDALEADIATANKRLDAVDSIRQAGALQPALDSANVHFADAVKLWEEEKAESARRLEKLQTLMDEARSKKNDIYGRQRRLRTDGEQTLRATFDPAAKKAITEKLELLVQVRTAQEQNAATFRLYELYRHAKTETERLEIAAVAKESHNVTIKPERFDHIKAAHERTTAELATLENDIAELQGLEGDPFAGMAWAD